MKQPLAVWITDLHLTPNTIDTVLSVIQQVGELCVQQQVPAVIIGGDVFTSRQAQPQSVLTAFANILDYLIDVCQLRVIAISGNHDKQSYISTESFLDAYNKREGFTLIKEYFALDVSDSGLKFHFIPYFDEKLRYVEYLDKAVVNLSLDSKNILFTHIAVTGVKNNDGSKVENELSIDKFSMFHKVIVGHYHNRQIIDNVVYTGSMYQGNHGEDEHKGCTIVYDDGSIDFVPLDFPPYTTYKIDQDQFSRFVVNKDQQFGNTRLKLNFKPNVEQMTKIQQLEALGVKVECEYEVVTQVDTQDVKAQFDTQDIKTYFELWCNAENIKDKKQGLKLLQI